MSTPDESGWRNTYCMYCGKFLKSGVEEYNTGSSSDYTQNSTYGNAYSNAYRNDYEGSTYSSRREPESPLHIILGAIGFGILFALIGGETGFTIYLALLAIMLVYVLRNVIKIAILIMFAVLGYNIGGWIGAIVAFFIVASIMDKMGVL